MDPILITNHELYERLKNDPELHKTEIWIEFPAHMKLSNYKMSTFGIPWSKFVNRPLKLQKNANGYLYVSLTSDDGKRRIYASHILLARAMIPNPENKPTVHHINSVKDDGSVMNLQWATQVEQINDPTTRAKIEDSIRRGSAVLQLSLDGKQVIKQWPSAAEAARCLGADSSSIIKICKGNRGRKTERGFRWRYDNEDLPNEGWRELIYDGETVLASTRGRIKEPNGGSILNETIHGGYRHVIIRDRCVKISRLICLAYHGQPPHPNMIANHITGNKLNDNPDNLEWRTYAGNSQHAYETGLINRQKIAVSNSKPVLQLDLNGNVIAEFTGIREASRKIGASLDSVGKACRHNMKILPEVARYKVKGYIWTFKERMQEPVTYQVNEEPIRFEDDLSFNPEELESESASIDVSDDSLVANEVGTRETSDLNSKGLKGIPTPLL